MPTWTCEQERVLFEHGNQGAEYCASLIARRFHVKRTPEATERHANRIGAPMVIYETCPECGRLVRKLNRLSGLCEECNSKRLASKWADIRKQLEEEIDDDGAARKAYQRERAAVCRLRKNDCEGFVDLSENLSIRRSEQGKNLAQTA